MFRRCRVVGCLRGDDLMRTPAVEGRHARRAVTRCASTFLWPLAVLGGAVGLRRGVDAHGTSVGKPGRLSRLARLRDESDAERKARVLGELDQLLSDPALAFGHAHIAVAYRAVFYDNPGGRLPHDYARRVEVRARRIQRRAQHAARG
jgi:hypothetical protein